MQAYPIIVFLVLIFLLLYISYQHHRTRQNFHQIQSFFKQAVNQQPIQYQQTISPDNTQQITSHQAWQLIQPILSDQNLHNFRIARIQTQDPDQTGVSNNWDFQLLDPQYFTTASVQLSQNKPTSPWQFTLTTRPFVSGPIPTQLVNKNLNNPAELNLLYRQWTANLPSTFDTNQLPDSSILNSIDLKIWEKHQQPTHQSTYLTTTQTSKQQFTWQLTTAELTDIIAIQA